MAITHATIRAAGLGDLEHILAEYGKAIRNLPLEESANLLSRPYDIFKSAVEDGLFFVVENAVGNFVAGAGVLILLIQARKSWGCVMLKRSGAALDCKHSFCKFG